MSRVFEMAKIENGHIHRFRDTFAVELLLARVPIDQVAILLGHSSVRITEKHYSPWVRARQATRRARRRERITASTCPRLSPLPDRLGGGLRRNERQARERNREDYEAADHGNAPESAFQDVRVLKRALRRNAFRKFAPVRFLLYRSCEIGTYRGDAHIVPTPNPTTASPPPAQGPDARRARGFPRRVGDLGGAELGTAGPPAPWAQTTRPDPATRGVRLVAAVASWGIDATRRI